MSERRHGPWKPILIIIAAGLVLSVSSCFGLAHVANGVIESFLMAAGLAGALTLVVGILSAVVLAVMELVSKFWRNRS